MFLLVLVAVFLSPVCCSEYQVSGTSARIRDDSAATATCNKGDWVSYISRFWLVRWTILGPDSEELFLLQRDPSYTFQAIECLCPYAMASILDGVTISSGKCVCRMSVSSNQHITVKATCRKARECKTNPDITDYKYINTGPDWKTGRKLKKNLLHLHEVVDIFHVFSIK